MNTLDNVDSFSPDHHPLSAVRTGKILVNRFLFRYFLLYLGRF
jgi:hypothetical protein